MAKPIYLKRQKNRKSRSKLMPITLSVCLFLVIAFGILFLVQKNEASVLTHTWRSEETGVILTFTDEGTVIFKNDLPNGIYHIVSPNTMEYTINDQTFLMVYRIEDNKLYWGMDDHSLECFKRYY